MWIREEGGGQPMLIFVCFGFFRGSFGLILNKKTYFESRGLSIHLSFSIICEEQKEYKKTITLYQYKILYFF